MATIPEAFALAVEHQRAGRLQAAEQIYRSILQVAPDHVDTLHMLGVLAGETGKPDLAVQHIRRAIQLDGHQADFHNNLGEALRALGRPGEAMPAYRRAVQLRPDFALAHNNLGNALKAQGEISAAIASYQEAVRLTPTMALAHNNLGIALKAQGRLADACASYRRALDIKPDFAQAHNNLGNALRDLGDFTEAIACYQRALALRPQFADVHYNLAGAWKMQGKLNEAVACYRQALQLQPDFADAHLNLGHTLREQGLIPQALAAIENALRLKPYTADAHLNLGEIYKDQGRVAEALASIRHAAELRPDSPRIQSTLLFTMQFSPDYDAQTILEEHRRWNEGHARPLAAFIGQHDNKRTLDRRLRIGYVSPDFRDHVVGRNLLPLLREHDRNGFEIHAYASMRSPDDLTPSYQRHVDVWHEVALMTDEVLAQRIRQDRIDILVDATLHMEGSRLLVFARKPAPVQVTFAGYPGTTGLDAIDYRLTDPYLDPPGLLDRYYSEASCRLPDTFWCYDPITTGPAVSPLPALTNGYVTLGCLSNFCKVNTYTLTLWANVLRSAATARLILLAPEGTHRQDVLTLLAQEGIAAERIFFIPRQPRPHYLELYHRIDLGLDTLPYNGHTTSLDSAWMGVPVVTMAGQTVVGRAGVSQMCNLGLEELIAHSPEDLARIVVELAGDLPRLSLLRKSLRTRMQNSPLMDAPRFARGIEAEYRKMWRHWCQGAKIA